MFVSSDDIGLLNPLKEGSIIMCVSSCHSIEFAVVIHMAYSLSYVSIKIKDDASILRKEYLPLFHFAAYYSCLIDRNENRFLHLSRLHEWSESDRLRYVLGTDMHQCWKLVISWR